MTSRLLRRRAWREPGPPSRRRTHENFLFAIEWPKSYLKNMKVVG